MKPIFLCGCFQDALTLLSFNELVELASSHSLGYTLESQGGWIQFDTVSGLVVGGVGGLSLGVSVAQESQERSLRDSQERAEDSGLEKCHLDH